MYAYALPSGLFPTYFLTKVLNVCLTCPTHTTCVSHLSHAHYMCVSPVPRTLHVCLTCPTHTTCVSHLSHAHYMSFPRICHDFTTPIICPAKYKLWSTPLCTFVRLLGTSSLFLSPFFSDTHITPKCTFVRPVSKLLSTLPMQNSRTVHLTIVIFMCADRRGCFCPLPREGADLP